MGMLAGLPAAALAQVKLTQDTLQCHVIGFSVGAQASAGGLSSSFGGLQGGNMADLYANPYIDFGLECDYKYKSNWMMTLDGDFWFGYNSNNLKRREERMGDIFTDRGLAMSWGGYDGAVTFYNRAFCLRLGAAKILPVIKNNPNSGLLLKLSGGWFVQQTKFVQDVNESPVPALGGRYARLYDHLRNGGIVTESVGFWFMSNTGTYINFKVELDFSQCISRSSRPYVIDNVMGLNGKDGNTYLDFLVGLKLTWMFPLTGKTAYDYYYY